MLVQAGKCHALPLNNVNFQTDAMQNKTMNTILITFHDYRMTQILACHQTAKKNL